jgi:hypothetical protein
VEDYLLTGRLSEQGASCDVDMIPFSDSSVVDGSTTMQRSLLDSQNNSSEKTNVHKEMLKEILPHKHY